MNIGFIGCGNMATAIIKGIRANNKDDDRIYVYDVYKPAMYRCVEDYSCIKGVDESVIAIDCDVIILAVKPNVIGQVCKDIAPFVSGRDKIVISIAAGKTLEFLENSLTVSTKIVRVMPNINAQVGEAISAYCTNSNVLECECKIVEKILSCFGKFQKLDEVYFPTFGVIGGCSPAFAYMFIDAMARAAVKNGMKKDDALKICAQAVLGSARMILESDKHPWELIDNVCSPGGTTIEGVASLQSDGFEAAVANAVQKSIDKDKKL